MGTCSFVAVHRCACAGAYEDGQCTCGPVYAHAFTTLAYSKRMDSVTLEHRLKELNAEISLRTDELLAKIRTDTEKEFTESLQSNRQDTVDLPPELIERLKAIRSNFQKFRDLLKEESLIDARKTLASLKELVTGFENDYPGSLLAVDLNRNLSQSSEELDEHFSSRWRELVRWDSTNLTVDASAGDVEPVLNDCSRLTEGFVQSEFGSRVIEPLLRLEIKLSRIGSSLHWEESSSASLEDLRMTLQVLIEYCASLPLPLSQLIPRRWGTYLVSTVIRTCIPNFFPDEPSAVEFEGQLLNFQEIEEQLRAEGWSHSHEISHFVNNFKAEWSNVRRKKFLTQLRSLVQQATPINEEWRSKLVKPYDDEVDTQADEDNGDWDWNEEDEDDGATQQEAGSEETAKDTGSEQGAIVDLWKSYIFELGPSEPKAFFELFRATTPNAYGDNHLWLYSDTHSLASHISSLNPDIDVSALTLFADENLHKFEFQRMEELDNDLLPAILGANASDAPVKELKLVIDSAAVAASEAGGPSLKESVLSQLVERIATYIVVYVEQKHDVSEKESQRFAWIITKLESLAVYFDDIDATVPTWTKLLRLRDVLMGNLVSIGELYSSGALADFTDEELTSLIEALFVDSSARASLLRNFNGQV